MKTRSCLLAALLIGLICSHARAAPAGKLVGWGDSSDGKTDVPAGNNFVAIDAGDFHSLAIQAVTQPGDFNNDGSVDAADYVVWRNGLGTICTQNDYDVWRAHFGRAPSAGWSAGSGAAGSPLGASAELPQFAIPEPATLVMVLLGMGSLFLRPVGSQTVARTVIQ